jgi:hypothetical protein
MPERRSAYMPESMLEQMPGRMPENNVRVYARKNER